MGPRPGFTVSAAGLFHAAAASMGAALSVAAIMAIKSRRRANWLVMTRPETGPTWTSITRAHSLLFADLLSLAVGKGVNL